MRRARGGPNNDLVLTAASNGAALNGLAVQVVDGAPLAGAETAVYDAGTNTLTVTIAVGESTGTQVAAAINAGAGSVVSGGGEREGQGGGPLEHVRAARPR